MVRRSRGVLDVRTETEMALDVRDIFDLTEQIDAVRHPPLG